MTAVEETVFGDVAGIVQGIGRREAAGLEVAKKWRKANCILPTD